MADGGEAFPLHVICAWRCSEKPRTCVIPVLCSLPAAALRGSKPSSVDCTYFRPAKGSGLLLWQNPGWCLVVSGRWCWLLQTRNGNFHEWYYRWVRREGGEAPSLADPWKMNKAGDLKESPRHAGPVTSLGAAEPSLKCLFGTLGQRVGDGTCAGVCDQVRCEWKVPRALLSAQLFSHATRSSRSGFVELSAGEHLRLSVLLPCPGGVL